MREVDSLLGYQRPREKSFLPRESGTVVPLLTRVSVCQRCDTAGPTVSAWRWWLYLSLQNCAFLVGVVCKVIFVSHSL